MSAPETSTPVPDEEIGYLASERFARVISPEHSASLTEDEEASLYGIINDSSIPGEETEKGTIHLDPPTYYQHMHNHHPNRAQSSRPGTRPGTRPSTRPASPTKRYGAEEEEDEDDDGDGYDTETEHEHPILAADEVLKRAGSSIMFPAVSPPLSAWRSTSTANNTRPATPSKFNIDDEDADVEPVRLSGRGLESRESLILSSLEFGERPEPLFPDSDPEDEPAGTKTPADNKFYEKPKRPVMPESVGSSSGHRFPSKDVWEEASGFSQLETTVSTRAPSVAENSDEDHETRGEEVQKRSDRKSAAEVAYIHGQPNEHYVPGDEVEFERKQKGSLGKPAHYQHQVNSSGRDDGLDRLLKKGNPSDDPEKLGAARTKTKRFPSKDIWEDVPPSLELSASIGEENAADVSAVETEEHATISGNTDPAETETEQNLTTSPPIEEPAPPAKTSKPETPARPVVPSSRPPIKSRHHTDPSVPVAEKKLPPNLPGRPKPKVPLNRPTRPSSTATTAATARFPSTEVRPPPVGQRPSVPPRTSGKIAAMKAGFLTDLDNRLKFGPQASKKEEEKVGKVEEKEKVVLEDVRKGRAKGPRRKLPTTTEKTEKVEEKTQTMSVGVWAVWSVGDAGSVNVLGGSEVVEVKEENNKKQAPIPAASTPPEISGTGSQTEPAVSKDDGKDTPPAITSAAEEKKEKGEIPALVPAEEHPEDVIPTGVEKVDKLPVTEKVKDADEVGAGEVATEGDVMVEV